MKILNRPDLRTIVLCVVSICLFSTAKTDSDFNSLLEEFNDFQQQEKGQTHEKTGEGMHASLELIEHSDIGASNRRKLSESGRFQTNTAKSLQKGCRER